MRFKKKVSGLAETSGTGRWLGHRMGPSPTEVLLARELLVSCLRHHLRSALDQSSHIHSGVAEPGQGGKSVLPSAGA